MGESFVDPKSRRIHNRRFHRRRVEMGFDIPGTREKYRLREKGCTRCIPRLGVRKERETTYRQYQHTKTCCDDFDSTVEPWTCGRARNFRVETYTNTGEL